MTDSVDALQSTVHPLAVRDKDEISNEEQYRNQNISDYKLHLYAEEDTVQLLKKKNKRSPWKGGKIPLEFGRLYCSDLPLACRQLLPRALLVVDAQLSEQDQVSLQNELKINNEAGEIYATSNCTRQFTVSFRYTLNGVLSCSFAFCVYTLHMWLDLEALQFAF